MMRGVRTMLAGAALGAAWRERARAEAAQAEREAAEARAGAARTDLDAAEARAEHAVAECERLRQELDRRQADLLRRRQLIERLHRSRRAERDWNQELRLQLGRAQTSRGALAEDADVREHILRAAIELVEADKGLLLSRDDGDSDGDLDLVCVHGFEHDPEHSAIAQRFAREVLDRDRIVREDAPADGGEPAAADAEIDNLVAIPLYLLDRFQGVVVCANREGGFEDVDDELLLALGDHAGTALHTQRLQNELNDARRAAMRMLADTLEAHDPLLRREAGEAAMLARMLCRRLELDEPEQEVVATAMLLRDVGHVAVPEHILLKPGPLSPEERSIVELHPRVGFRLIGRLPALDDVAAAVLYHHERCDGTGYPVGLAGDAIPRAARIVAVVDAYSAMVHDRPHRPARSPERALAELSAAAGTQLDPEITEIFLEEVRGAGAGLHAELADAVASALDTGGLPGRREETAAADPLTLLAGHRTFREAAQAAATVGVGFTVALVELDGLEDVNRREGYLAGDRMILSAARNVQLAVVRLGGAVYRDGGRRFGVLLGSPPGLPQPDLLAELHTEFAIGPPVRVGLATWAAGETGDDVVSRARAALGVPVAPPPER